MTLDNLAWLLCGIASCYIATRSAVRTDPNKACDRPGHLGWAVVHDLLAHPFMAATGFSRIGVRFHDWTSHKAWPRKRQEIAYAHFSCLARAEAYRDRLKLQGAATELRAVPGEGYYVGELP